ncbi:hypothetical protein IKF34_03050 [Candidatus Saccharibacteria bacterium]|nr:hypothetical protein [Candidatus Saccharibacteria bacterium]
MDEEVKEKSNKSLWFILCGLGLVIVGLVAWVVINIVGNVHEVSFEEKLSNLKEEVDSLELSNIDDVVDIYQAYIDSATVEEKIELYQDRINWVLNRDFDRDYGGYVLSDYISIDGIERSQDSAADVMNYASYYQDNEIFDKYQSILIERVEAAGDNYFSGGGEG